MKLCSCTLEGRQGRKWEPSDGVDGRDAADRTPLGSFPPRAWASALCLQVCRRSAEKRRGQVASVPGHQDISPKGELELHRILLILLMVTKKYK